MATEVELASHIIAHFKREGWEVYQEVPFYAWVADIVVTKGELVGVIECKQSYNFVVLEQAERWLKYAHQVWVATWTPRRGSSKGVHFGHKVAKMFGIGVVTVNPRADEIRCREAVTPATRLDISEYQGQTLNQVLRPEHQNGYAKAGSNEGKRFTPFAATCKALRELVEAKPGLQLRDAVAQIKHHYSSNASAVSSLRHWIEKGKVKGIKLERQWRYAVLMPTGVGTPQ